MGAPGATSSSPVDRPTVPGRARRTAWRRPRGPAGAAVPRTRPSRSRREPAGTRRSCRSWWDRGGRRPRQAERCGWAASGRALHPALSGAPLLTRCGAGLPAPSTDGRRSAGGAGGWRTGGGSRAGSILRSSGSWGRRRPAGAAAAGRRCRAVRWTPWPRCCTPALGRVRGRPRGRGSRSPTVAGCVSRWEWPRGCHGRARRPGVGSSTPGPAARRRHWSARSARPSARARAAAPSRRS